LFEFHHLLNERLASGFSSELSAGGGQRAVFRYVLIVFAYLSCIFVQVSVGEAKSENYDGRKGTAERKWLWRRMLCDREKRMKGKRERKASGPFSILSQLPLLPLLSCLCQIKVNKGHFQGH